MPVQYQKPLRASASVITIHLGPANRAERLEHLVWFREDENGLRGFYSFELDRKDGSMIYKFTHLPTAMMFMLRFGGRR
jgi:hypothetical protein